jgi:hypothetical protein
MSDNGTNGAQPLVIDQIKDEQIVSWAELSTVQTKRLYLPAFDKYIIYRTTIPMDKMAEIQAKYDGKQSQAILGRFVEMLKYLIVEPAIRTPEAERAVLKADSGLLLQIINEAVTPQQREEFKQNLGEA